MPKQGAAIQFHDLFGFLSRRKKSKRNEDWKAIKENPYLAKRANEPISKVNNIFTSDAQNEESMRLRKQIGKQFQKLYNTSLEITKALTD